MSSHAKTALQSRLEAASIERLEYLEKMIKKPIPEGPKLNLGCGKLKLPGFVNVDINPDVNPDVCMDLDLSLPLPYWEFSENRFSFCVISQYLEHVSNLVSFMKNLYRVMASDGLVWISCPYAWSDAAIEDPTHVRFINENSLMFFNRTLYQKHPMNGYDFPVDFETESINLAVTKENKKLYAEEVEKLKRTHINIVNEIQFLLRVVKPMRDIKG